MRAKGAWEVRAGVIPLQPEPDYTRRWAYTSEMYEADARKGPQERTYFADMRDEAMEYAKRLTDPAALNWVELTWIWY